VLNLSENISILVAARNEADNIICCLESIEALSYPREKLQILIGNDDSDDKTEELIENFIIEKPHFQLITIKEQRNGLKGKANVLAQLAQIATGNYFFFTDADIQVPQNWIENILPQFTQKVGIVTGITTVEGKGFLPSLQAVEWLFALSAMRMMSLFEIPLTAMGNNMAVSKKAYWAVGGYEKIGFSVVEDYALFRAIVEQHFDFVQLFDSRVLTISQPIATFRDLMVQRKRWMRGAMSLPISYKVGVFANGFMLPLLVLLGFYSAKAAIIISIVHYLGLTIWLLAAFSWIKQQKLFIALPAFWFYHLFTNFAMILNYYFTKNTTWKGRQYD
jgi:cellulose synthase/poly-beta-1,6-N-acetylglucosamine synthase-like glycosyltransferase